MKKETDKTTLYLRHGQIAVAMDIEVNVNQTTEKGKKNRYVLSGDLIAGRVSTTINADDSEVEAKSWYHLDHLNSTKMVTDANGEIEVNYIYRAFGEQLKRLDSLGADTDDSAKYSYGGKELDDVTNLYYFNARYYDATIGRFINVDPVQDGTNWYVYTSNNPLSFVDPTGLVILVNKGVDIDSLLYDLNKIANGTLKLYMDGNYISYTETLSDRPHQESIPERAIGPGAILIKAVIDSDNYLFVKSSEKDNSVGLAADSDSDKLIKGIGVNAVFNYDPSPRMGHTYNLMPDGTLKKEGVSPFMQVAHELIHAFHFMTGLVKMGTYKQTFKNPDTGETNTRVVEAEEYSTVGLVSGGLITENDIRAEHGLNQRGVY